MWWPTRWSDPLREWRKRYCFHSDPRSPYASGSDRRRFEPLREIEGLSACALRARWSGNHTHPCSRYPAGAQRSARLDHRIRALLALARTLWLRGFSDQAVGTAQKAIDEAVSREHPVSMCVSLIYASSLFLWVGDFPKARSLIEQLIAYAGRYSLEPFRAAGLALKGKLAIACDDTENGITLLRNVLKTIHANITIFSCRLSPAHWRKDYVRPGGWRKHFLRSMTPLPVRRVME
jgi:hypothetical protein